MVSLAESPARSTRYRCALVVWRRRRSPCPHRHPNPTAFPGGDGQPAPGRAVFRPTRADPRPSVAVMPFATMSGDQSYFADGLTEDVTTALARNSELQIIRATPHMPCAGRKAMCARSG